MKTITATLLALSLLVFTNRIAAMDILVVESYDPSYSWDASYKQALIDKLGGQHRLVFFAMDTKRLPKSAHPAQAEKAWSVYRELKHHWLFLAMTMP